MRRPSLLIVEDDREVAESMLRYLEPKGYRIRHSRDGLDTLRKIAEEQPDILVMDIRSPRLGGLDAARRIRRAHPTISIVFANPPDNAGDDRQPQRAAGSRDWSGLDRLVARAGAATEPDQVPTPTCPAPGRQATPEDASARIMVVDDRADMRELLYDYLESEGYTVEALEHATDALIRLTEFRPHLVLLDILMPGLSGLSALRQIRARDPEVGVIMVTGNGDVELAKQTLALGAFDYVTKPIDFHYLKRSLETLLLMRKLLPGESGQGT